MFVLKKIRESLSSMYFRTRRYKGAVDDDIGELPVDLLVRAVQIQVNETFQLYEVGVNDEYPLHVVVGNDLAVLMKRLVVDCQLHQGYVDESGNIDLSVDG